MSYETILVDLQDEVLTITLNRLEQNNTLTNALIFDLLDAIESTDDTTKIIVLQGQKGIFCMGMDFNSLVENTAQLSNANPYEFSSNYMQLLTTLSTINKIIVAKLDGKVLAGGVGLVAASDLVYASHSTTFSLTEALWGLLPANVMPYLIRRIGFQAAYHMTITAETMNAEAAKQCHLVDEVLDTIDEKIIPKIARIRRLQTETILDLKNYFNQLNEVTDETRQLAIDTLAELISKPRVQTNIQNFVQNGTFPWS
jgi:polyketide biosynthesis enoyl-CoA hydratase PksH